METVADPANAVIPKGPRDRTNDEPKKAAAPTTKRKRTDGLVKVAYLGERFMPMKYEVYADGSMTKLTFAAGGRALVTQAVADVLTGKTKQQYDGERPVNSVEVLGTISDTSGERWEEVS